MELTSEYFTTLFNEFATTPCKKIEAFISIAKIRVPCFVWGDRTQYAQALMTAHMLSTSGVQGGGAAGGPVTQETVGDLSRSYGTVAAPGSGDAWLATTRYGIDFIALRDETIAAPMTTGPYVAHPRSGGRGPGGF